MQKLQAVSPLMTKRHESRADSALTPKDTSTCAVSGRLSKAARPAIESQSETLSPSFKHAADVSPKVQVRRSPFVMNMIHGPWENECIQIKSPRAEHHAGGSCRTISMFLELRKHLEEVFDQAPEGSTNVITRYRTTNANPT